MLFKAAFIIDILALSYLINKKVNNREIDDYTLRLGYKDFKIFHKPIEVDMRITPHLFLCGLSGNGKTKMIEYAMQNKKCVLFNVFDKDLKSIKAPRVVGNSKILEYLKGFLNIMKLRDLKSKPIYLVVDELLVLCTDKNITSAIMDILAIGRHYNVFLIGISQIGTKEVVKFKDLFNTRVSFRQVEESSYRTVLGYSPESTVLKKREFYYYSHEIGKGYTYSI